MKWTTHSFAALAAVAWADGEMKASEADALRRAATELGLSRPELAEVERMSREPVTLDAFSPDGIEGEEAEYLYALACLISAADGHVAFSERDCVASLGKRLGLPPEARERAERAGLLLAERLGLNANALEALAGEVAAHASRPG